MRTPMAAWELHVNGSPQTAEQGPRSGRGRAHKQQRQREAGQVERLVGLHAQRGPLPQEPHALLRSRAPRFDTTGELLIMKGY